MTHREHSSQVNEVEDAPVVGFQGQERVKQGFTDDVHEKEPDDVCAFEKLSNDVEVKESSKSSICDQYIYSSQQAADEDDKTHAISTVGDERETVESSDEASNNGSEFEQSEDESKRQNDSTLEADVEPEVVQNVLYGVNPEEVGEPSSQVALKGVFEVLNHWRGHSVLEHIFNSLNSELGLGEKQVEQINNEGQTHHSEASEQDEPSDVK
eukprot:CAMPEP_0170508394 /NCGR_PEP_ID=MMETSP0208-20121228/62199_1 /TAXON_ID=197538 /ORGANISM="Strombidium inclinatum, Strain S3" /LENGTH=210 /DNA_ID=CAMNT_0010791259 /DNA_START=251 /DNA_END=884 /DNA_ORIENTATION=+